MPRLLLAALPLLPLFFQPAPRLDHHGDPLPEGALLRIGTTRLRPGAPVTALAFTPDRKLLVTAEVWTGVHVWDVATGKHLSSFGDTGDRTLFVALSADGAYAAFLSANKGGRVYAVATGKQLFEFQPGERPTTVQFTGHRKTLAVFQQDGKLETWDVATGKIGPSVKCEQCAKLKEPPVLAADGKMLAASPSEGRVALIDIATGKVVRTWGTDGVAYTGLLFSEDGKFVAAAHGWLFVGVWVTDTGKVVATKWTGGLQSIRPVAFTPDGKHLLCRAAEAGWSMDLWPVAKDTVIFRLPGHYSGPGTESRRAAAFSADGSLLATADDARVRLWDAKTGKPLHTFDEHLGLTALRFTPDGKGLLAVSLDGPGTFPAPYLKRVSHWDAGSGKLVRRFTGTVAAGVPRAVTSDGVVVATIREDAVVEVVDVAARKLLFQSAYPQYTVYSVDLTADGKFLLVNREAGNRHTPGAVELWDVARGKKLLEVGDAWPLAVVLGSFSADQRCVLVRRSGSPEVACYDTATGRKLPRTAAPCASDHRDTAEVSPDRRLLAIGTFGRRTVTIHELATSKIVQTFEVDQFAVSSLAWSPDGRTLAVGTSSGPVVLWDLAHGKIAATLKGHGEHQLWASVDAVAWSPDGKRLASGSQDTTLLIWDAAAVLAKGRPADTTLTAAALASLWKDLAAEDAKVAFAAQCKLAQAPKDAVAWLRKQLPPATRDDVAALKALVDDLNHPRFAGRERAMTELAQRGDEAISIITPALESKPSLEVHRRAEQLLKQLDERPATAAVLRQMRALAVLVWLGTPEARALLEELAAGADGAWLTREARQALRRLP